MQKKINCIILASGNGSNALNLIRIFHIDTKEHKNAACSINISAVVSNIENAPVIEKVRLAAPDIPVFFLPYASFSEREYFEKELESIIRKYNINCIILAGFMKILSKEFVSKFHKKIINIHPSLLPAFKGKDAIKSAFDYGVKYTGVTVHYVTPEVDAGPIICQEVVKIEETDTVESLELKIHDTEHKIYPAALKKIFV
ncbi:MAG: phosphoribosylglycinamide formyltransferase [Candidatus Acidulodesulfobacterium acidiphilum]|uniref:Phosphoribosylglycinamide formyltransferase n=1 Tax=Candidatus Acidulodesulfobacterium acidiphilum TaxID=2597224 RepID=A0A520X6G3_9DELT|nr:MAG: phosphoribosylglycinamide formyltransferase [Candidatus Acidulodesulfobacterium acidiphilum]